MAAKKHAMKGAQASVSGFSKEERAAMRARAKELKARATKAEEERDALAAIAQMPSSDRVMAERLHAIIKANAPALSAKTWYGMPAYAKDDNVICFFRNASKFKTRYATLGFSDEAHLDEGHMWPTDFALTGLTSAEKARIVTLLKKALG
jgi:uncharacterized protein YdhG (YjbR/CyaY superfamily)